MLIMMEEKTGRREPTTTVINDGYHKMTPKEMKTYDSLEELQGVTDSAHGELMQIREDISTALRPRPGALGPIKARRKKTSKARIIS